MAITTIYDFVFARALDYIEVLWSDADATPLASGGVAVSGTLRYETHLLVFDAAGNLAGGSSPYTGETSAMSELSNGNIVLVSADSADVYYALASPTGWPHTGSVGIGAGPENVNLDVAGKLAGGRFVIAIEDYYIATDHDIRVFIRDEDDGSAITDFFVDASSNDEQKPSVAALADGGFAIAYHKTLSGNTQLWYGVYEADGTPRKAPALLDNSGSINQNASVISLQTGGFAIAYEDNGWSPGDSDITLARFTAAGNFIDWHDITQNTTDDTRPSTTVLSNGMIVVGSTGSAGPNTNPVWTLVDQNSGARLTTSNIGATAFNDTDTSVAGMAGGRVAAFFTDMGMGYVVSQVLQGRRFSTGDAADDFVIGDDLVDIMEGGEGNDTLSGAGGDDILGGGVGFDYLEGGDGNDTLRGGHQNDGVSGGAGDDVIQVLDGEYIDWVDGGAGIDTLDMSAESVIGSTVDLGAGTHTGWGGAGMPTTNIENFYGSQAGDSITGSAGNNMLDGQGGNDTINAVGGNDVLLGGSGDDLLNGGTGDDLMAGSAGNDIYNVDSAGDVVFEHPFEGIDRVNTAITYTLDFNVENLTLTGAVANDGTGNALDNVIIGNSANNVLKGLGGNDTLTGLGGSDTMIGGLGHDLYNVDVAGDVVTEFAGEGTDKVNSAITYTLGADVENLTLTGIVNTNGTGNALSNIIVGNSGNNVIVGMGGGDTMAGMGGNDDYNVDSSGDVVTEAAGGGTDRVFSTVSFTLIGFVENLTLLGAAAIDGTGNTLDNTIIGNAANNVLNGGVGVDILNGQGGDDTMIGGTGNDAFFVDSGADVVLENAGEGTDRINSTVTYTASANIENLTLLGSAAINGFGNTLNNILVGNSADNVLDAGAGADSMQGGLGNDTYHRDNLFDSVTEALGGGTDLVYSSVNYTMHLNVENLVLTGGATQGFGNALNNTMTGNALNNTLSGGLGDDTLIGGLGNDDYNVDSAGDVVTEFAGEGTDRVFSTVTFTLGANVESLTLLGADATDGTGNALDNTIAGNGANNVLTGLVGNDTLNGQGGADTMVGGHGDDTYFVDAGGDVVTELAGEGTDKVNSAVTHTLAADVENLTLIGAGTIDGIGNGLANQIIGGTGANVLNGLGGNDLMNGGGGNDVLVWDAADTNVQGGTGTDRLRIDGSGATLDLTLIPDNVYRDVEIVDLTGTGNNSIRLALADVLASSSTTDVLRVDGNAGDSLFATDSASWATGVDQVVDGVTYRTYTQGAGTLLVDIDVTGNL